MAVAEAELHPDLSRIHAYSREDKGHSPPAVTHFINGQKNLYYINASHNYGSGTSRPLETPTCRTIEQAIVRYKPKCVVVEALHANDGLSPPAILNQARRRVEEARSGKPVLDEWEYAAVLADENGIPFIGGEPPGPLLLKEMAAQGYFAKDVMAYHLLRRIPYEKYYGRMQDEAQFVRDAEQYLRESPEFKHIPPQDRLTVEEFRVWYDQHKSENKNYLDADSDLTPFSDKDATYLQIMSYAEMMIRDKSAISTISDALNTYGDVLVIYGGSHLTTSRPVWEQMFQSKGETVQLVPDDRKLLPVAPAKSDPIVPHNPPAKRNIIIKVAAGASIALAGLMTADFLLQQGKASKKVLESVRGWVGR